MFCPTHHSSVSLSHALSPSNWGMSSCFLLLCIFKPTLEAAWKSHSSQERGLTSDSESPASDVPGDVGVTESVDTEHDAITGVVATGSAAIGETREADVEGDEESAEAAVSTWAAWWRAARWRFLSLSVGPRWRGRREVEEVGGQ